MELTGYAVLADGSTVEADLIDLSYEGGKIRTPAVLAAGDRLNLAVFRRGMIEAEVRWSENGFAGVVFTTYEVPTRQQWPRRSERVQVVANVTMRKPGQPNFEVQILDASPEGCKIEFVDRPRVGERVWIKFHGLETLEAEVCWVENFVMGAKFAKRLHPAVFDLLVEQLSPEEPEVGGSA